jgi:hypothetical protein
MSSAGLESQSLVFLLVCGLHKFQSLLQQTEIEHSCSHLTAPDYSFRESGIWARSVWASASWPPFHIRAPKTSSYPTGSFFIAWEALMSSRKPCPHVRSKLMELPSVVGKITVPPAAYQLAVGRRTGLSGVWKPSAPYCSRNPPG